MCNPAWFGVLHLAASFLLLFVVVTNFYSALKGYRKTSDHINYLKKHAAQVECDANEFGNRDQVVFLSCPVTSLPDLSEANTPTLASARSLLSRRDALKGVALNVDVAVRGFSMSGGKNPTCVLGWNHDPLKITDCDAKDLSGALHESKMHYSVRAARRAMRLPSNAKSVTVQAAAADIWVGKPGSDSDLQYQLAPDLGNQFLQAVVKEMGSSGSKEALFQKGHRATAVYPRGEHKDMQEAYLNVGTDGQTLTTAANVDEPLLGDVNMNFKIAKPKYLTVFGRQTRSSYFDADDEAKTCKRKCLYKDASGNCLTRDSTPCIVAPSTSVGSHPRVSLELADGHGFVIVGHLTKDEAFEHLWDAAASEYRGRMGMTIFLVIFTILWTTIGGAWTVGSQMAAGGDSKFDKLLPAAWAVPWSCSIFMCPLACISCCHPGFGMCLFGIFCCCCPVGAREQRSQLTQEPLLVGDPIEVL